MKQAIQGFTLIELMIVIVVVAILAAVAYPNYSQQVRKTARKEVAGLMLDVAGRMERIRSQKLQYEAIVPDSPPRYAVTLDVADPASFTITARPRGDQEKDLCGTITLNHRGIWTFTRGTTVVAQHECL